MSQTQKPFSDRDANQTQKLTFNDVDASTTTSGYLVGAVGRRVTPTITTTTIANDTINYAFSENGTALYTISIVYTDGTRGTVLYYERTA